MGDVTLNITNPNMDSQTLTARLLEVIDEGMAPYDDKTEIYNEGVVFVAFRTGDVIEHMMFEKSALADMSFADIHNVLLYCQRKEKIIHDHGVLDFQELERIAIELRDP